MLPKLAMLSLSVFSRSRLSEFLLSKLSAIPHICKHWSLLALTRYNLASTFILPRLKLRTDYEAQKYLKLYTWKAMVDCAKPSSKIIMKKLGRHQAWEISYSWIISIMYMCLDYVTIPLLISRYHNFHALR